MSFYIDLTHKGRLVTSEKIEKLATELSAEFVGDGYKTTTWEDMDRLSKAKVEAIKDQSIPDRISKGGASDPQFDFFDDEE